MVMGVIILKKVYTLDKYISVGMITAGISICTIVSSQDVVSIFFLIVCQYFKCLLCFQLFYLILKKKTVIRGVEQNTTELEDLFWWCLGKTQ